MNTNSKILLRALFLIACLMVMVPSAVAQVAETDALGGEFLVNTFTDYEQTFPVVSMSQRGDTLIVWQSEEQDGDNAGIYGRYYEDNGYNTLEYRVNEVTASRQEWPAATLAWLSSDGMALWTERYSDRGFGIHGRIVAGSPLFSEYLVSTNNESGKGWSAISSNHHGGLLLAVWSSYGMLEEHTGIYGQYLSVGGEPIGPEFHVNTNLDGWKTDADVAMAPDGRAVVTWVSTGANGVDGIYAQRFAADKTPVGEEMLISLFPGYIFPDNIFISSAVAMDPVGNFVVAWTLPADVSPTSDDVYARRYFADGTPIGPEFRVNAYLPGRQSNADVGVDRRGNFVVVWQSSGQDGSGDGIYGQLYNGFGEPVGGEFLVNETTAGQQRRPAVAMRPLGRWTVVWTGQNATTGSYDIFARKYQHDFPAFMVTSTVDPGDGVCTFDECTLREILAETAANPGSETITFGIPGEGPHTIQLAYPLEIKSGVTFDGYTQPGAQPNTNPVGQGLNTVIKVAIEGSIEVRSGVTFKGVAIGGGIDVYQTGATFHGAFVGTDASGTVGKAGGITLVSGGGNLTVGGAEPAQRNLIVGRIYAGMYGSANVNGNLLGTDITGTRRLGSGNVDGLNSFLTITNNVFTGVSLFEASASISNNYMGTDVTGTQPLGGGSIYSGFGAGFSANNNLIAYTGGTPIIIGNSGRLSGNRIFANGGLGIDVGNNGVSLNDPGDLNNGGRGGIQNFPIANWVYNANGETVIEGILNSRPNGTYPVEFFANSACDPSGFGEGERILGRTTVRTSDSGLAVYRLQFPGETPIGDYVTAIATGPNTSEFSPCRVVGAMSVNSTLTMTDIETSYSPDAVQYAPGGLYTVRATFTNHGAAPLRDLYYRITTLTEANLVLNAQGGPVGEGGVVAVQGEIAPGASFAVEYVIGLQQRLPFQFFVDAFGLTDGLVAAGAPGFAYDISADDFVTMPPLERAIYLPFIAR